MYVQMHATCVDPFKPDKSHRDTAVAVFDRANPQPPTLFLLAIVVLDTLPV